MTKTRSATVIQKWPIPGQFALVTVITSSPSISRFWKRQTWPGSGTSYCEDPGLETPDELLWHIQFWVVIVYQFYKNDN